MVDLDALSSRVAPRDDDHAIDVEQGSHITITVRAPREPADRLVPVERVALRELGLEERAIRRLVEGGELRAVTIGRRRFTRLSYLLSLVDELPQARAHVEPVDDIEAAARKRARRAGR
jgi:hypothetical protein